MMSSALRSAALPLFASAGLFIAGQAHASTTHAAFDTPVDSVATDGFNNLTAARITSAQLAAGIASNVESEGGATLRRTSGGAYPASAGLYQFAGNGSTFEIAVSDAVDGLTGLTFQSYVNVSTGSNGIYGLLAANNLPRLSFNGGSQFLLASSQQSENLGYTDFFTGQYVASDPNNPNHLTFSWDFAALGVTVPVTSFRITFATDNHAQIQSFQLDQQLAATTAPTAPVPEPETYALMLAGLGLVALGARRRRH